MKRKGRESAEIFFSGDTSKGLRYEMRSISLLHTKLPITERPLEKRFSTRALRLWKYELPAVSCCIVTPFNGNCGNGTNNCCSATVEPFKEVLAGSSPTNGLL